MARQFIISLIVLCSVFRDGTLLLAFPLAGIVAPSTRPPRASSLRVFAPREQRNSIRGDKYGTDNNSTIPTAQEAAVAVGVKPPRNATAATWARAWRFHQKIIPLLHCFDKKRPPESSKCLQVLWLKALSSNDESSPVFDNSLGYDLLPRGTRLLVGKRLRSFYPRLHHANVEIRTAYLDRAVSNIVESIRKQDNSTRIRLVSMGAGYDVRSIKFRERGLVDKAIELDLPQVIQAKTEILKSRRFLKRRPWLTSNELPEFHAADLNDMESVRRVLKDVLAETGTERWHTIFLFEGVMIYLDKGVPSALLGLTSDILNSMGLTGSLCFADRLENVPGGDMELGRQELERGGWKMTEWQPKPGLARHMGCAQVLSNKQAKR